VKISFHAFAKINLFLNIYGKDDTGYHKMQSVFVFLSDIFDILEIETDLEFDESSGYIQGVDQSSNSIRVAAQILRTNFRGRIPHVDVVKRVPIAGGIGGGSSDSACFVNAVFNIWGLSMAEKVRTTGLFKNLGADSAVFLHLYFGALRWTDCSALLLDGTGIDGSIDGIRVDGLRRCYILLVNDGRPLQTSRIFKNHRRPFARKIKCKHYDMPLIRKIGNSLEETVLRMHPELSLTLAEINSTSPTLSGISGSGASCFGVYPSLKEAQVAKKLLSRKYSYVETSGVLHGSSERTPD
jgi:4-diphosphocytidyl-2-C-methyl-D-erythritol kinase